MKEPNYDCYTADCRDWQREQDEAEDAQGQDWDEIEARAVDLAIDRLEQMDWERQNTL